MKIRITILAVVLVVATGLPAAGEQIRLKTGDFLQGDVIGERSSDDVLTIRLYRTGGIFTLRWDQLTIEDEARIKESLGLGADIDEDVEMVDGHIVLLKDGSHVIGRVENPDDTTGPVRLKLATGTRDYPRDFVAKITPTKVQAQAVDTPEDIYERFLEEEGEPETGDDHIRFAEKCMGIGLYDKAKTHYEAALEDEELPDERVQLVKNRLTKVAIYVQAKDATDRVKQIKRLRFQKKFDEALAEVDKLLEEYAENPKILELLKLERLKRQVTADREKYFRKEVHRRFFRTFDRIVRDKVRDKEVGMKDAQLWAQTPKGLTQEIFDRLAEDLGIEAAEAMDFFAERTSRQVHRYNYGTGTFIHPDMMARARKMMAAARGARRAAGRNARNRGAAQRQQEKPKSPDEWWNDVAGSKDKERFLRAHFAEAAGVLTVLRFELQACRNCGGKGVTVTQDANSAEEVRHICTQCNL
ncbi:MAG: hypothetical protein ABFS86_15565, partial [Planctomycetota bacterium]